MTDRICCTCPKCNTRVGFYKGPIGPHLKIESKHFRFEDGSVPKHGGSSKYTCTCGHVFDIISVLRAVARGKFTVPAQDGQNRGK